MLGVHPRQELPTLEGHGSFPFIRHSLMDATCKGTSCISSGKTTSSLKTKEYGVA